MSCAEPRILVQAYLDHELDVAASLEMEQHLRTCAVCAAEYDAGRGARAALGDGDLYRPASDLLRARIRASLGREASPRRWRLPALGGSLAVAVLALLLVVPTLQAPAPDPLDELVAGHVRSLMVDHLTDVASSDKHTVKPWFDGKLDFAPPVIDLADGGFPLVGGRIDYLGGRPVAALVYGRHRHFVNLFVRPDARPDGAERAVSRHGFQVIEWREAGMAYTAISDLAAADLGELVSLFRGRAAP